MVKKLITAFININAIFTHFLFFIPKNNVSNVKRNVLQIKQKKQSDRTIESLKEYNLNTNKVNTSFKKNE